MRILLVYPRTPPTFWSFTHAIKFISKKSSEIPLGILTVAALLPADWPQRLIDMNVTRLRDKDLRWADYVFLGGMNVHLPVMQKVIRRCNELDVKVVLGGPVATLNYSELLGVDHFILNEAELTLPRFIRDLKQGCPRKTYRTPEFPDIARTPIPRWELLDISKYASLSLQFSRGCPYNCDFCSIATLNGRRVRTKSREQFMAELESLYQTGWRGNVFIVDDNFIGNRHQLKKVILPAMIQWMESKDYPFNFTTEVSLNLADDDELAELMVQAGFRHIFVGVETPNKESLAACGKAQNLNREINDSIKNLQQKGLIVSGGFIVGFDNDPPDIFRRQIQLIQSSGIVTAMVGLLNAPKGTKLYHRMQKERRLLGLMSGDNLDGSVNFIPRMDYQKLIRGYKQILESIYAPKNYFERVKTFLQNYELPVCGVKKLNFSELRAFIRSIWKLGFFSSGRRYYWKLLFTSLFKYPEKFPLAVTFSIYGFHFRKIVKQLSQV